MGLRRPRDPLQTLETRKRVRPAVAHTLHLLLHTHHRHPAAPVKVL